MILQIRRKTILRFALIFLAASLVLPVCLLFFHSNANNTLVAGGTLYPAPVFAEELSTGTDEQELEQIERFHRPSKDLPYPNPFSFSDFVQKNGKPPIITQTFSAPEEVILAYYGILRDASNMSGYSGGCGTIGSAALPYPYAYELLTPEKQKEFSLEQFTASFRGIGYTTLLKLLPAYAPPGTPPEIQYYMVEIEVITGEKTEKENKAHSGSQFAYYYGLVTAKQEESGGWKIQSIDYLPEDFLCAPWHSWFYLSDAVVQIVYGDNLKLIDRIEKTEQAGSVVSVYASGNGMKYRFDFVRLTNGYDILLHEFVLENESWTETSLLTRPWEYLKLTIHIFEPSFSKRKI